MQVKSIWDYDEKWNRNVDAILIKLVTDEINPTGVNQWTLYSDYAKVSAKHVETEFHSHILSIYRSISIWFTPHIWKFSFMRASLYIGEEKDILYLDCELFDIECEFDGWKKHAISLNMCMYEMIWHDMTRYACCDCCQPVSSGT